MGPRYGGEEKISLTLSGVVRKQSSEDTFGRRDTTARECAKIREDELLDFGPFNDAF